MVRVTEETLINIMKTVYIDHNRSSIMSAFRHATREMMTTTLKDDGVCEVFESPFIRFTTSDPMSQGNIRMVLKEGKIVSLVTKFVPKQVQKKLSKAARQMGLAASPSPPPALGEPSQSEKEWKPLRHRRWPEHKNRSTFLELDDGRNWPRRGLIKKKHGSKTSSSGNNSKEIKLPVAHLVNVVFADTLDYRNNRLPNRSLTYDEEMEARTAKLGKKMETIMKPYSIEDADTMTSLSFLRQY